MINILKQEEVARKIATLLHSRHCHSGDGEGCTWDYETWETESNINPLCDTVQQDRIRPKYLAKAHILLQYFNNIEEVSKVVKFLVDINPKLAYQLVKEL